MINDSGFSEGFPKIIKQKCELCIVSDHLRVWVGNMLLHNNVDMAYNGEGNPLSRYVSSNRIITVAIHYLVNPPVTMIYPFLCRFPPVLKVSPYLFIVNNGNQ